MMDTDETDRLTHQVRDLRLDTADTSKQVTDKPSSNRTTRRKRSRRQQTTTASTDSGPRRNPTADKDTKAQATAEDTAPRYNLRSTTNHYIPPHRRPKQPGSSAKDSNSMRLLNFNSSRTIISMRKINTHNHC